MFISFVLRADEDCLRNENIYVANLCGSRSCCCFNDVVVVAGVVVLLFSALVSVLFSLLLVCSLFRDLFALSAYPTAIFFCSLAFVSLWFFVFVFVLTAVDVSAGRLLHCTVDPCKWDLLPGPVA